MEMCFTPGAAVPAGTSIPVLANPRLAELRDPSEDWTGVTSTAERRKLQNRLNQRARRRRNQKSKQTTPPDTDSEFDLTAAKIKLETPSSASPESKSLVATSPKNVFKNNVSKLCELGNEETRQMLSMFAEEAYVDYINGKPCPGYLTTLVRVNVFHAMVRNAQALDFNAEWLTYEAISPFNKLGPGLGPSTTGPSCPENMRPTALQLAVEHHPWIDFFPHPQMRDNFLQIVADKGEDYIDEDDMCRDIVDVGAGAGVEEAALIVWGEPWDPRGWEATEPFLRKWGWLLVGCTEMLEGTNCWREKRGLKRLKFN
ncbi:hypothetical protein GCG54_00001115 [Colletotrichum gloeosporioides]|uniref:BZIP domain-containing protein n=1 Tax=Colletotrichum gloeosporioides TaxID=474922 RepID=A0A8H4C9R8_COLGL|nr:uncharacterized protein GCG54_00001115 [Colletotrichum gloeosporioides]KAF3800006.1 hypothetical protein GCG54_00001115 [Colletotrichum gloeosporioides]